MDEFTVDLLEDPVWEEGRVTLSQSPSNCAANNGSPPPLNIPPLIIGGQAHGVEELSNEIDAQIEEVLAV